MPLAFQTKKCQGHKRIQAGGEVRSTEPLLSTHPLTEPRKVTDFVSCCNGRKCRQAIIFFIATNQWIHDRAVAVWKTNNQIAQGNVLGFIFRVIIPPRRGQKHFPPNDNAFALSGRRLLYYPWSPGCCPGLVAHCPFQGRIRQLGWGLWDNRGNAVRC